MHTRYQLSRSYGYLAPVSFSVDLVQTNLIYNMNIVVMDDPQVNIHRTPVGVVSGLDIRGSSEVRRELMADLVNEFASSHDDLLRKLAE